MKRGEDRKKTGKGENVSLERLSPGAVRTLCPSSLVGHSKLSITIRSNDMHLSRHTGAITHCLKLDFQIQRREVSAGNPAGCPHSIHTFFLSSEPMLIVFGSLTSTLVTSLWEADTTQLLSETVDEVIQ